MKLDKIFETIEDGRNRVGGSWLIIIFFPLFVIASLMLLLPAYLVTLWLWIGAKVWIFMDNLFRK